MSTTHCTCDPVPMTCGGEGASETCETHGRPYREWVERGDILAARLAAVKEVMAKARRTPAVNDPYHVAMDIVDDLEAAVYLEPGTLPSDHGKVIDDLRAALTGVPPAERVAALAEVLEGHREEPHTYSWPDKTRGPRCSCKHAKWGPQHLAAEIAASPAMRDLLADERARALREAAAEARVRGDIGPTEGDAS